MNSDSRLIQYCITIFLTFGTQNYAIKRTFVPNVGIEMLYLNDKVEEVKAHLILFLN